MEDSQWSPTIPVLPSCFSHIFADAVSSAIRCIECSIGPQLNAIAWRPYPQTIQRCAALLNDFPYCSGVRFCPAVCWRPPSRAFELPLRCAAPYDDEEVGYAAIENVAGEARPSGACPQCPKQAEPQHESFMQPWPCTLKCAEVGSHRARPLPICVRGG